MWKDVVLFPLSFFFLTRTYSTLYYTKSKWVAVFLILSLKRYNCKSDWIWHVAETDWNAMMLGNCLWSYIGCWWCCSTCAQGTRHSFHSRLVQERRDSFRRKGTIWWQRLHKKRNLICSNWNCRLSNHHVLQLRTMAAITSGLRLQHHLRTTVKWHLWAMCKKKIKFHLKLAYIHIKLKQKKELTTFLFVKNPRKWSKLSISCSCKYIYPFLYIPPPPLCITAIICLAPSFPLFSLAVWYVKLFLYIIKIRRFVIIVYIWWV